MPTSIGKATVDVTFDKSQIGRELSSSIEGGVKSSEGSIAGTFKRIAGIATAAFAGAQVFSFLSDSVDEAREANKVAAQTEAVIKSTGGAAKLTAGDFSKLADSISFKTGIDDDQIQSAENLLATFTNLRNEVGEGNDIFSQATQTAVDMGAALGGDASSNAIQLGKALNDPIRGMTALTRVGVTFDDEQRKQITTMQEHGDILGAQKIILAELNKEFGGSAEATATAGDKFGVFVGNVKEGIGKFLIPILDSVAEWAMTTLPNAFGVLQDTVGPIIDNVIGTASQIIDVLFKGDFTGGPFAEDSAFIDNLFKFRDLLLDDVFPAIQQVFGWMTQHLPVVAAGVIGVLVPAFVAWAVSAGAAALATIAAAAPFIALSLAVGAVAAGLVYAYTNFDAFRAVVDTVASFLRDTAWPIIQTVFDAIVTGWKLQFDAMKLAWDTVGKPLFDILVSVIQGVITFVQTTWPYVQATFEAVIGAMQLAWDTVGRPIFDTILIIAGAVVTFFTDVWGGITDLFSAIWEPMTTAWDSVGKQIFDTISSVAGGIYVFFAERWGDITGFFEAIWGPLQAAWDRARQVFDDILGVLGEIIDKAKTAADFISRIPDVIPGPSHSPEGQRNREVLGLPGNAAGTDFWRGGLTRVNEQGGEIINLPRGSQIIPHDVSMAMAGGGATYNLTVVQRERVSVADEFHRLELLNG